MINQEGSNAQRPMRLFELKKGRGFCHFGLKSSMVFSSALQFGMGVKRGIRLLGIVTWFSSSNDKEQKRGNRIHRNFPLQTSKQKPGPGLKEGMESATFLPK